ncbi:hypothetical protein Misp01_37750 [Microtetraspora sp. NBRC 13810]|uniref:NmrA family NAD(P)-binding protein n=1 Tax=Microtetraspora sp. NBRC 13810 TaxID=3030990 RepID=UPI0024A5EBF8|nr:NmrA family NAD(P)-binding protein [Microtetraspora sp. NBRC 13810]GLW08645.1 hypothetical protein Misp01_37750 [Microtetraspora sp. NBRC 13810]
MTTLVTGATGNTGRHVVAELVRRGERVRALTRNPAAAAGRFPAEVELVAGTQSIRAEGVVREPYDFPSALVHEADIAAVAAVALLDDGHAGRSYNLTGPESLTPRERIAILSRAVRRDIAFEPITREQAVHRLMATGVSRADAEYVVGWYAAPSDSSTTVDETVERVTGRPARTFTQWVDEHAERFQSQG